MDIADQPSLTLNFLSHRIGPSNLLIARWLAFAALCLGLGEVRGGEPFPAAPFNPPAPAARPLTLPSVSVPDFRLGSPFDEHRHRGHGQPLQGTSWLNRPFHAGWFVGGLFHEDLMGSGVSSGVDGRVEADEALLGGYRLGWDFDHYWGLEGRVAFARPQLFYTPARNDRKISRDWFWDAHLLYYPWGDSRWRPYLTAGVGVATVQFDDAEQQAVDETLLHVPFGAGMKYLVDRWLVLRFDLLDNLAIGTGPVDTMHNWSATVGVEVHFGGHSTSTSYYPW